MPDWKSGYRIADDIRYRTVGGEGIVVHQTEGEVLVLNEVGAHIMDCLRDDATRESIVASLTERFDVSEETAQQDLNAFFSELLDAGVIISC